MGRSATVAPPAARPTVREEQKNLTRTRVLDGAARVFAEKSFVEATMEDIAVAAGVTRVTVYAHFSGKGELVRALGARVYDIGAEVYGELAGTAVWSRAGIRTWLGGVAARWQELAPTIRVLVAAAAAGGVIDDVTSTRQRYHTAHERYVAILTGDAARWHGVSAAEARQRALMAVLQLESFLSVWITGGWPMETGDPLDLLADAISYLLGPALHDRPS